MVLMRVYVLVGFGMFGNVRVRCWGTVQYTQVGMLVRVCEGAVGYSCRYAGEGMLGYSCGYAGEVRVCW